MVTPVLPEANGARMEVLGVGKDTSYRLAGVELERRGTCGQIPGAGVGAATVVTDDGSQSEENRRGVSLCGCVSARHQVGDGDRAVVGDGASGCPSEGKQTRCSIGIRLFLDDDRAALGVGERTNDILTRVERDVSCTSHLVGCAIGIVTCESA